MTPTINHAKRILQLLPQGLTKGLGKAQPGKMCIEALVCFVCDEQHSDTPSCVGEEVRKAKIALNDCDWPDNKARANGMRKIAIAQLGSDTLDQEEFKQKLKFNSIKRLLPFLIQKHFDDIKDEKLLEYKQKFESLVELNNELWEEFYNHYNHYHYYHYHYYNYHYYNDYLCNYHYNYHYYNNYGLPWLELIADVILQTLIEMKSPGCEWLYLCD